MKRGRLPLTALRSFEVAGRLLSFSRAAEELFVSQAAISRQVRELEVLIGKPLFDRLHQRVELTELGRFLLDQLTTSFDDIDRRLTQVIVQPDNAVLRISVEPNFASSWLVTHLNRFREEHPEVDVHVNSTFHLVEFRNHEAEIAIRYGRVARSWPRTEASHLLDCRITPVLAPDLLATGPRLTSPNDLKHYTLLHEYDRKAWSSWYLAVGLEEYEAELGPIYSDGTQAIHAAMLGHGVALCDLALDAELIRNGSLVRPFETEVAYGAYWLVVPDFQRLSRAGKAFADWIVGEFVYKH